MIINLNGRIVPRKKATVSLFDHGFLYGFSVYETLRTYGGKPFLLEAHFERLQQSAARLALRLPFSLEEFKEELKRTLEVGAYQESQVRVIVSRGEGELGYDPASCRAPTFAILVSLLPETSVRLYQEGVEISLVSIRRNLPDALDPAIKTGNLLNQILAWSEGQSRGAYESLMLNYKGELTECTMSNIFLVKDGLLRTPALECGILAGLTRELVLQLARQNQVPSQEASLVPEDLYAASEAFLTVTSRELVPVVSCDRHRIGDGKPGPITRLLHERYRAMVERLMEDFQWQPQATPSKTRT
ncbi:MAG: aminotransferase class IV [Acidobacteriota bacterium]